MEHLTPDTLDHYLDDALASGERVAAEAHLATCAACREELAALRGVGRAARVLPSVLLPADLTRRVLTRIAPTRRPRYTAAVSALAGVQLTLVAALVLWFAPMFPDWLRVTALVLWDENVSEPVSAGGRPLFGNGAAAVSAAPLTWLLLPVGLAAVVWVVGNWLLLGEGRPGMQPGRE